MNFDYSKICSDLISSLKEREKEIISRRFGFGCKDRETLESIGKDFKITRERVRQIQDVAISKIKPKLKRYQKVFGSFLKYFKKFGNLRKEERVLTELGGDKWKNEVLFLLTLQTPFQRFIENDEFYSFWYINEESLERAKTKIDLLYRELQKKGKPFTKKEILSFLALKESVLDSYLEISKKIHKNPENLYGLNNWPEINPRGIKDKAYLVLKKMKKPLHFTEVANLIEGANLQTVHNELIRDERFVLIGRGIYALKEWGYFSGQVKDIIFTILKKEGPLTKEEILKKVLEQRQVKENTILLNLSNRKYFLRDPQGRYRPKIEEI